jgi:excisionase family DNA binding protein
MERETLTVREVARLLGVGKNCAYDAIRRGQVPSVRIGKRIVIPRSAFQRMLDEAAPVQRKA